MWGTLQRVATMQPGCQAAQLQVQALLALTSRYGAATSARARGTAAVQAPVAHHALEQSPKNCTGMCISQLLGMAVRSSSSASAASGGSA